MKGLQPDRTYQKPFPGCLQILRAEYDKYLEPFSCFFLLGNLIFLYVGSNYIRLKAKTMLILLQSFPEVRPHLFQQRLHYC